MAADPSYPFYPIASIFAAALLLLVLTTTLVRQRWNLGIAFLCFWLFLETLTNGIDAVLWSDNADVKHLVYCDIGRYLSYMMKRVHQSLTLALVSRLQIIARVVRPMITLNLSRRMYLIACFHSVEAPNVRRKADDTTLSLISLQRRRGLIVEWTLGLFIPLLVAWPLCVLDSAPS